MPEYLLKYQCWPNGCGRDWKTIAKVKRYDSCPCCGDVRLPYYTETIKEWES